MYVVARMWKSFQLLAIVVVVVLRFCPEAHSADESLAVSADQVNTDVFSVDTAVFDGDEKKPFVRTKTLFSGKKAYDKVDGTNSVVVFDFERRTIRLLDNVRNVQTGLPFDVVRKFQTDLQSKILSEGKGLGAFLANPTFIREFDASNSTISLRSPWLTYTAKGNQSAADEVERFIEFADWSARLGSILNPTAPPARARLELNEALKKHNWRVTHVTRIGGPRARKLGTVRSEHEYRREFSTSDEDLIRDAEKDLKNFKQVSFDAYHNVGKSPRVATKK